MKRLIALLAAAVSVAAPAAAPRTVPAPRCDAACLEGLAGRYMDALVSKKQADVPWAKTVRYAENGVPMMIGDGLWGSVTAHGNRPLVVADPSTGNVAWFGIVEEHGQPAFQAVRFKADGRALAEIEVMTRRKEGRPPFGDPASFVHDPAFLARLAAGDRSPRERMVALVQGYFNSVAANDGTVLTRFRPDCARVENGLVTTSGDFGPAKLASGCEAQLKAGLFRDVTGVRGLRFPVVDEERGLVVVTGARDHNARAAAPTATDGRPLPVEALYPRSYGFIALFRIRGGAIERIEDVSSELPYLMPPWEDR